MSPSGDIGPRSPGLEWPPHWGFCSYRCSSRHCIPFPAGAPSARPELSRRGLSKGHLGPWASASGQATQLLLRCHSSVLLLQPALPSPRCLPGALSPGWPSVPPGCLASPTTISCPTCASKGPLAYPRLPLPSPSAALSASTRRVPTCPWWRPRCREGRVPPQNPQPRAPPSPTAEPSLSLPCLPLPWL